jgi:hypothetical protein
VNLQIADDLPGIGSTQVQINPDGSFLLQDVVPGARYRVTMGNIQNSGAYLFAGRYGEENPLSAPFVIPGENGPLLQHQNGFSPGRVETVVLDRDRAQPGILTVLVPHDRGRFDLYRTTNSNTEGRVAFSNVTPGDYKVFAWEEVKTGAWQDPLYMEKFEDKGRLVHVDKAGSSNETVQVIRAEGY